MSWITAVGKIASHIRRVYQQARRSKTLKQSQTKQAKAKAKQTESNQQKATKSQDITKARAAADKAESELAGKVDFEDVKKIDAPQSSIGKGNNNSSSDYTPPRSPYTPPRGKGRSR